MATKSILNFTIQVEFPPEVNVSDFENKIYSIWDLSDYQELMADYYRIFRRGGYFSIKDEEFRWVFFLDTYETYSKEEAKTLELAPVFYQKWYKEKYLTVVFLDKNFKHHKTVIPATSLEYSEEPKLYSKLYQILSDNDDIIGKYIKRKKCEDYV